MVERMPEEHGVGSPILPLGTRFSFVGGSSSVVERLLAKEKVAGSTPVSRSQH